MDFAVQRLTLEQGGAPNYHLLDSSGKLVMVADQNAVPRPDARRQVRLAQPDGQLLATIDLPQPDREGRNQVDGADYAIIHEYAVYAILSVHRPATKEAGAVGTYFTLEVEGEKWLALCDPRRDECYLLYDEIPDSLDTYSRLTELDLPPSIGRICRDAGDYAFGVNLAPTRLQQTGLIILALAFLIDQVGHA